MKEILPDNIVIVIDTGNYLASYSEEVPFKAKVIDKDERGIFVKSIYTGKEYDLYYDQILEAMDIKEIRKLVDVSKYGCE
jgi:hypothetical protein